VLDPLGNFVPFANASVTMNMFILYPLLDQKSKWLPVVIVPLTLPTVFCASLFTPKYCVNVLVPSMDGLFTRCAV
jgi:hypothetical protein